MRQRTPSLSKKAFSIALYLFSLVFALTLQKYQVFISFLTLIIGTGETPITLLGLFFHLTSQINPPNKLPKINI